MSPVFFQECARLAELALHHRLPSKLDPFLCPLLVHVLNARDLYTYGMEKSFTPAGLRRLLESSEFRITGTPGILFMPGWLRMLDLVCHTRGPVLAKLPLGTPSAGGRSQPVVEWHRERRGTRPVVATSG